MSAENLLSVSKTGLLAASQLVEEDKGEFGSFSYKGTNSIYNGRGPLTFQSLREWGQGRKVCKKFKGAL